MIPFRERDRSACETVRAMPPHPLSSIHSLLGRAAVTIPALLERRRHSLAVHALSLFEWGATRLVFVYQSHSGRGIAQSRKRRLRMQHLDSNDALQTSELILALGCVSVRRGNVGSKPRAVCSPKSAVSLEKGADSRFKLGTIFDEGEGEDGSHSSY